MPSLALPAVLSTMAIVLLGWCLVSLLLGVLVSFLLRQSRRADRIETAALARREAALRRQGLAGTRSSFARGY